MNTPIRPRKHDPRCEDATGDDCNCRCRGPLHRNNLLRLSLATSPKARVTPSEFDDLLEDTFGSAFTSPTAPPRAGQRVRPSRPDWEPHPSSWNTARGASQVEQRIVDVTLRDVFAHIHAINLATKHQWLPFVDELTLRSGGWRQLAASMESLLGDPNSQSGYLWSANLIAATTRQTATPTAADMTAALRHVPPGHLRPLWSRIQTPRGRSGNSLQVIDEVANQAVLQQPIAPGMKEIAQVLAQSGLPAPTQRLLALFVGTVVSTDLWHHPGAVHHLLLPVVSKLRQDFNVQFSLDSPTKKVEELIDDELGSKWRAASVW